MQVGDKVPSRVTSQPFGAIASAITALKRIAARGASMEGVSKAGSDADATALDSFFLFFLR